MSDWKTNKQKNEERKRIGMLWKMAMRKMWMEETSRIYDKNALRKNVTEEIYKSDQTCWHAFRDTKQSLVKQLFLWMKSIK